LTTEISKLVTEQRNEKSMTLDRMTVRDILRTINDEDKKIAHAVEAVLPDIETAVTQIVKSFKQGGRLFYVGAGTSGRLGVLDAAECMPTFGTTRDMVQAILAGGLATMTQAVEGIEDDERQGAEELKNRGLTDRDVVIGIAASGRTPYTIGALKYAGGTGAYTVALSCNPNALMSQCADCKIEVVVGPEVLTGSTRMKAATAHKMVVTMISTAVMIQLGKVYENLMVDVQATNVKLIERAKRIVMHATGASYTTVEEVLGKAGGEAKTAIVMIKANVSKEAANDALLRSGGLAGAAIEIAKATN